MQQNPQPARLQDFKISTFVHIMHAIKIIDPDFFDQSDLKTQEFQKHINF